MHVAAIYKLSFCSDWQCMMLQISLTGIAIPTFELTSFLASTISFSSESHNPLICLPVFDV
jgi:hypothetical protein